MLNFVFRDGYGKSGQSALASSLTCGGIHSFLAAVKAEEKEVEARFARANA